MLNLLDSMGTTMKNVIRKAARKLRDRFCWPMIQRLEQQDRMLQALADYNYRARAKLKHAQNEPIHVLFVCHAPALWGMFDSVYRAIVEEPDFTATIVALPCRHGTLPEGQYKDEGVFEFLKEKGVNVIRGYDREKDEWLNPVLLNPDYVFFQTPYRFFPDSWSVEQVSMIARVCYIPYGTLLAKGEVASTVHPENFFRYTSFFFVESPLKRKLFEKEFAGRPWYNRHNVVLSGHPKIDFLTEMGDPHGRVWKRGMQKGLKRILWTPRWRTSEGTCHFFDYKDFFFKFCKKNQDVDFVFRPHPLCLQNFLKTGEMSKDEQASMKSNYDNSENMSIDVNSSYTDTFLSSDILITDFSSMMAEYLATGKPIIYTHRKNIFNDFGRELSRGFYWVGNVAELEKALEMLIVGEDPLKEKREELMREFFFIPEGGSGRRITEYLKSVYVQELRGGFLQSKRQEVRTGEA